MSPVQWRPYGIKGKVVIRAEFAQNEKAKAFISLIVLHGRVRPYILHAEVQSDGRKPWISAKAYIRLNPAVVAFDRLKTQAEEHMTNT